MSIPYRRCFYIDDRGEQCDTWFPAIDSNKLCPAHREIITPGKNGTEESKVKYIDLVNDQRQYCYHFLDGTKQEQSQTLIFEYKDDIDGSVFDKLDNHIAFIEKVIEDMKARLHSSRAVRTEKLDGLSEEERKRLRAIKIERAIGGTGEKKPSFKKDPVAHLVKTKGMNESDAKDLLSMDVDALLEKFTKAKEQKEGEQQ